MKLTREKIQRMIDNQPSSSQPGGGGGAGEQGGTQPSGASSLNGLQDVEITNETAGDVLVYNSQTSKWENNSEAPKAGAAPWDGITDQINDGNEFNVCDSTPTNNRLWLNYRGRQGSDLSNPITEVCIGNGQGSTDGVTLKVDKIEIGGIVIEYDSTNGYLKINGKLHATGGVV